MKRVYCDGCKAEITDEHLYSFDPLLHICELGEGRRGGYIDKNRNLTSGRAVHFDLCAGCYNEIFAAAYRTMKDIRKNGRQATVPTE